MSTQEVLTFVMVGIIIFQTIFLIPMIIWILVQMQKFTQGTNSLLLQIYDREQKIIDKLKYIASIRASDAVK